MIGLKSIFFFLLLFSINCIIICEAKEGMKCIMDNYTIDSLELYLNTLKDHILTADEEKELFLKMKNGDLAANQMIIESNLRLVVSLAKKYQGLVKKLAVGLRIKLKI